MISVYQKAIDNTKESRKDCQEADLSKDSIEPSCEAGANSIAKPGDDTVITMLDDTNPESQSLT